MPTAPTTEIKLKGSKSITNRALLLTHLAKIQSGKSTRLKNVGECDDTYYMEYGLSKLKAKNPGRIHLGNAGTAVRFLTTFATAINKDVTITGCKRMRERPIKPLVDALIHLGADIKTSPRNSLPLEIKASTLKGGTVEIPGNISSQYISSLLMIAPLTLKGITILIKGELTSKPYIEMTIKLMQKFGVKVETTKNFKRLRVHPSSRTNKYKPPTGNSFFIEGDASSASYLGAYAALKAGSTPATKPITITNIPTNSIQGDLAFKKYLQKMGCRVTHKNQSITVQGPATLKKLKPLGEIDMNETPDLVITFAVLSAFAKGKTRITNIANLKVKESDRLTALKNELTRIGIKARTGKDYIAIEGIELDQHHLLKKRAKIKTYEDHRIAMAFGVLKKTILPKLKIQNPSVVRKSYPEFWSDLNKLNRT